MKTYIYIACAGHSGSTLLERLLATSPDVFAMGEVCHFSSYFDDVSKVCGCGAIVQHCPFWRSVAERLGVEHGTTLETILPTDGYRAPDLLANLPHYLGLLLPTALQSLPGLRSNRVRARSLLSATNHWRVVDAGGGLSANRVLVDKSMSASRLLEIAATVPHGYRLCAIHLVRDGRATAHSHRTLLGVSMQRATRRWRRANLGIELALRRLHSLPCLRIRYEALCEHSSETLARIAERFELDVAFSADLGVAKPHTIGGNQAKLHGYTRLELDRRWEQEVSYADRMTFARTAGWLNRRYGY